MRPLRFVMFGAALVALALSLAGCGGGPASLNSDDVAVVGSQHITKAEFDALLNRAKSAYKALKDQAVSFLVQRAEFEQKADDMGVKVDDKKVDQRLKTLKKQYFNSDEKKYKAALAKQGLTETQVREDIRSQILSQEILDKVTEDVKVSDDDVKKYYASHKSQYGTPETREIRHILVSNKALANKLYDQLKAGANFGKLAKKYSKDPGSAQNGGKLTISKGQTVAPFDQTAFLLGKGTISRPVKTQYGYHIIQPLSDVHPAKTTPLNQVKATIKQQLLQQKKNEKMQSWVDDTKKDFKKKIRYAEGYAPPAETTPAGTATTGG